MARSQPSYPLVGKFCMLDDDEQETFRLCRVTADLGDGFVLADLLDPNTGTQMFDAHLVLHLSAINGLIFNSFADVERFEHEPYQPPGGGTIQIIDPLAAIFRKTKPKGNA